MNRLKEIWQILLGHVSIEDLRQRLDQADYRARTAEQDLFQTRIDLDHAKAGITMLKSQLPKDYEQRQKAESDKLGDSIIADMQEHPEKYRG